MTIRARGKKNKKDLSVLYHDGEYFFNGEDNELYQAEFEALLSAGLPVLGTYIPEDIHDETYIAGVLREHFFDKEVEIKTEPKIEAESEKGVVY